MPTFTEDIVEQATLYWLQELGYTTCHATEIETERQTYSDAILIQRLENALQTINPNIPHSAIEDAIKKLARTESPNLYENNRRFHKLLTDGIDVNYQKDGQTVYDKVWLIDFHNPDNNDWLALNQFTVIEGKHNRRPDVVIFINGLPIAVIELKNPTDENATIRGAFNQLQTYKSEIPSLFPTNEILVISDGTEARVGTLTADWERFSPWRTIDGQTIAPKGTAELETVIKGIFTKTILLDLLRYFIVFEVDGDIITKKIAGYHQYHAVNKAVAATIEATQPEGDRKVGVVWHTQGSGKSLTMAFYAGKIIQQPEMVNPTLVILTDRNDLDDQLFNTFSLCSDLLRQTPTQAEDRENLQELLQVASGGIVFTTIQKFAPDSSVRAGFVDELPSHTDNKSKPAPTYSNRRNIVLIADEAHRSQYGLKAKVTIKSDKKNVYSFPPQKTTLKAAETSKSPYKIPPIEKGQEVTEARISYGYAKYLRDALPNASFIGFTGTPIEATDISTPAVFGDYIDIYDIQRAVEDEATVRIYYEGRLAKLELEVSEKPNIDPEFEEITENEEEFTKEKLKSKWARLEALVGSDKRIGQVARDIVTHFENRLASIDGKGMIVCMSRRICADLYNAIIALKPDWHHDDDDKGIIKVVMTGSAADDAKMRPHIRSKKARKDLAKRFKKPDDEMKLVIVRDMWLTGFDAPCLHTLYIDKPMQGHGLMQAIARVNRVFKDKPGGLVVDYLGIAEQLKEALKDYTESDREETGIPTEEVLAILQEKYEIVQGMYHGFDYQKFFTGTPTERLNIIPAALNHILGLEDSKERYIKAVTELSQAFALVSSTDEAIAIRDEVGFFQSIKAAMVKHTTTSGKSPSNIDAAVRQIVSKAVAERLDCDIRLLSKHFPSLCHDIAQKYRQYFRNRRLLNIEQSCEEVSKIVVKLHSLNVYPSKERIAPLMTRPQDLRNKQVRERLKEIKAELKV